MTSQPTSTTRCQVPVLLMIFSRPDSTRQVLAAIRAVRPPVLYIAADGPRADRPGEAEKCAETRAVVTAEVDWDCKLVTLFRPENLGLKRAVVGALDWFFGQDPSFFSFCEWMLQTYRNNPFVMHIGGANFQDAQIRGDGSYYFSKIAHVWGWAGWRRAWACYDPELTNLDEFLASERWRQVHPLEEDRRYWEGMLRDTASGRINTWDYQWLYSIWRAGGVSVIPNANLVSNIGFNAGGTFNIEPSRHSDLPAGQLRGRAHPSLPGTDMLADRYSMKEVYGVHLREPSAPKRSEADWKTRVNDLRRRLDVTKNELHAVQRSLTWRLVKWLYKLEQRWRNRRGSAV
jgi:hypothetical protein